MVLFGLNRVGVDLIGLGGDPGGTLWTLDWTSQINHQTIQQSEHISISI